MNYIFVKATAIILALNVVTPVVSQTIQQCSVDVDIYCMLKADPSVDCSDIPAPTSASCNGYGAIHTLDVTFDGHRTCGESVHNQGSAFSCTDYSTNVGSNAYLVCYDTYNPSSVYCNCFLTDVVGKTMKSAYGGSNSGQAAFPQSLTCDISANGQLAQKLTFDTSGNIPLELKNKFGMLNINGCTDMGGVLSDKHCRHEIDYYYVLSNSGAVDFTVTEYSSTTASGSYNNLMNVIGGTGHDVMSAGKVLTLKDPDLIDVCEAGYPTTTVDVKTSVPGCQTSEVNVEGFVGI